LVGEDEQNKAITDLALANTEDVRRGINEARNYSSKQLHHIIRHSNSSSNSPSSSPFNSPTQVDKREKTLWTALLLACWSLPSTKLCSV
jgi:hypothetical protein